MSIHPKDVLLYGGGECFQKFGVPFMRQTRAQDVAATFTRTGGGAFFDKSGVLRQASANRVRVDWSGGVPYLLLEPEASNYFRPSDDLTTGGFWTLSNANRTANDAAAPDGTTTATKLYDNSASGVPHRISHASATVTAGQYQPITGFAKADEYDRLIVSFGSYTGSDFGGVDIDLGAETITDISAGDGATENLRLVSLSSGWYKFSLMARIDLVSTSGFVYFGLHNGTSYTSYTGDGASGLHLWRLGLDRDGTFPSSSIATTSAEVTRGADTFYAPFPHAPQAMTVYLKFIEGGTSQIATRGLFHIGGTSGTTGAYLSVFTSATAGRYRVSFGNDVDSAVSTTIGASGLVSVGDTVRLRVTLGADGATTLGIQVGDASEVTADGSAPTAGLPTQWESARFYVGSLGASSNQGPNAFSAIKVARGVQSMTDMRAIYAYEAT